MKINYWKLALRVLVLLIPAIVLWVLDLAFTARMKVYRFVSWLADKLPDPYTYSETDND